ncbi:hypothetical protein F0U59_07510 [Archangium gephyra]|nr:hypothetical protein F0U59_07510 [Archangium gephyra]
MGARTEQSLINEFRNTVHNRAPLIRARAAGQRAFLEFRLSSARERNHSAIWWIHLAHLGTLDKLAGLLRREGPYETLELLAIARNIFENLVWLRLMSNDHRYGLVFYSQLIRGQIDNLQGLITKISDEADLFESVQELDDHALMSTVGEVIASEPSPEAIAEAQAAHRSRTDMLDDMVRREFSLFSGPATTNGYGYQAHLLRTKIIPKYQEHLNEVTQHKAELDTVLPSLLDARMLNIAINKWNWADRAKDAGMEKHYRFLYPYTSKLLHSTPLNITSDKALTEAETLIVLDYIVLSAGDLLDQIERFTYPGQINAIDLSS